ncbi:MAG: 30S ribosomal protein S17 [Candidatus Omnitrophica bacterium]|nr:30S ribosomal protein S17 [Candidatus Omnitrophota bacterium]
MKAKNVKKEFIGLVKSAKMNRTATVEWEVKKMHPLYKKSVVGHKKVKVRNESNAAKEGDVVRIIESRPLSKEIRWKIVEIMKKAQIGE